MAQTSTGTSTQQAVTFLRNTIAGSPEFGREFEVVSIDTEPATPGALWLHLDNGSTIRLDVQVEARA